MDPRRFDSLTRSLASPKTRRGLLGSLAALGAGLFGARTADAQVTQAQCGNKICAANPGVCTNGCVCCVWSNGNSRCTPPGNCTGTVVAGATTTTTQAPTTQTTTQAPTTVSPTTTQAPTTAAPTTTTPPTTAAPTTTAAPGTTTTTTTARPSNQGTCEAGQDTCGGGGSNVVTCNSRSDCFCVLTEDGATACVWQLSSVDTPCESDAECSSVYGAGSVCVICGTSFQACMMPCPV